MYLTLLVEQAEVVMDEVEKWIEAHVILVEPCMQGRDLLLPAVSQALSSAWHFLQGCSAYSN